MKNFEINLIFLIKPFLHVNKNTKQKVKYLVKYQVKSAFEVKRKGFSIILKGFQLPKIVSELSHSVPLSNRDNI